MDLERENCYCNSQDLLGECKRYEYYHAKLTMIDGNTFDGIIENVDKDRITVLVGEDVIEGQNEIQVSQQRQNYGYGNPRRRFRRFRRRTFPISNLATLALLPYIAPPPYPYYPYY